MQILKRPVHAAKAVPALLLLLLLPAMAGAAAWKALGPDRMGMRGPSCLAFDPARPSRAFAGLIGGGLARSVDGGETWQRASRGLTGSSVSAVAVHPASRRGTLFAAGYPFGVAYSLDDGSSWTAVPLATTDPLTSEPLISKLVPDPTDPDILYAVNTYPNDPLRLLAATAGGGVMELRFPSGD